MILGAVSGTHYRLGTGFEFVAQRKDFYTALGVWDGWCITGYNAELNAYIGTYLYKNFPALETAPGGIVNVTSSGEYQRSPSSLSISPATFCEVSSSAVGNGTVSLGGTAYGGKYRLLNASCGLTVKPSSGYKVQRVTINGTIDASFTGKESSFTKNITISDDTSIVAYFVPTAYTVTCNAPVGGTVSFAKNGEAVIVPFTAAVDDIITCTATPDSSHAVQNFSVDGSIAGGGSYTAQTFSFTIFERADDPTYNCSVTFSERMAIVDTIVGEGGEVTVVTGDDEVERDDSGRFNAYIGNQYKATADDAPYNKIFDGWFNANGEIVADGLTYSWIQGNEAISLMARYSNKNVNTVSLYVGTSTSDYGTGSTAYVAGCRASITAHPETSGGGYLDGVFTITATLPSGTTPWTFSGVYIRDDSSVGNTKFFRANGASSVSFNVLSNVTLFAIFANGAAVTPADVDQGNSHIATGSAASGLFKWEGASSLMTMRWHSKMFVANQPISPSSARVYADAYSTGSTNDVRLRVFEFQSPDTTDSRVTEVAARSQDAFRLPIRRPEKYLELEVSAPHQVTQIAVATSMEALWQQD